MFPCKYEALSIFRNFVLIGRSYPESCVYPHFWRHISRSRSCRSPVSLLCPFRYRIVDSDAHPRPTSSWDLSQASCSRAYSTAIRCARPWYPRAHMAHTWLDSGLVWRHHIERVLWRGGSWTMRRALYHGSFPCHEAFGQFSFESLGKWFHRIWYHYGTLARGRRGLGPPQWPQS
jgi:hypothetical protein